MKGLERSGAEALIEEARRRQRRRRFGLGLLVLVVAVTTGTWVTVGDGLGTKPASSPTRPGSCAPRLPPATTKRPGSPVTFLVGQRYGGPSVLAPFDPVTGRPGRITVGWISAIAPGGGEALGLDTNEDLVYPVDLTDDHVGKAIQVGRAPVGVAFSPDGHSAYVANAPCEPAVLGWSSRALDSGS